MSGALLELVAKSALVGAKQALARDIEFESGEPVVVVTVAWRSAAGDPFVVGSAVPDGHGHELLADSLRQSASEAEDSFAVPSGGEQ